MKTGSQNKDSNSSKTPDCNPAGNPGAQFWGFVF